MTIELLPLENNSEGIDVSHHQRALDWQRIAAAGVRFVYVKASEGVTPDAMFTEHWKGAKGLLQRGPYLFWNPAYSPRIQVDKFYSTVTAAGWGELPPVIDAEHAPYMGQPKQKQWANHFGECLALLDEYFEKEPIIYTNAGALSTLFGVNGWTWRLPQWAGRYPLWLARYNPMKRPQIPTGFTDENLKIWQYDNGTQSWSVRVYPGAPALDRNRWIVPQVKNA